ncbi:MAG TPA: DUF1440 domain-containing protein [Actinomycetes bacterium]|jgi:hypothetical protein|nr:DUF1440 domain-containing protein [Actinomycetes bacterium]HXP14568.1 DUF1440 domain-containing protein [Actinomycetes bacterium]HXQ57272.1 DUF1440 domain-containing protein [Actinomycetes bacterium]
MKGAIRVLFVGAAAGYLAGQVMDKATTWFYERQSDASKQREGELLPEGAPLASARKLAGLIGAEPTDEQAGTIAATLHQGLGQLYGVVAAALTRRGVPPVRAGLASGAAGFLLVDELANSLFFTPPPQAYPVESHLRGLVGHLTFGATTGALLALARRLGLL